MSVAAAETCSDTGNMTLLGRQRRNSSRYLNSLTRRLQHGHAGCCRTCTALCWHWVDGVCRKLKVRVACDCCIVYIRMLLALWRCSMLLDICFEHFNYG